MTDTYRHITGNYDSCHCKTCFFSETFPGIILDEHGICNHCKSNDFVKQKENETTLPFQDLYNIAKQIKKDRKGKYDCIIGASGGLDSSYVIYVTNKLLGLNPLVVKYDHGFNYQLSTDNLVNMCKNLEIDLIIDNCYNNDIHKTIKYSIISLKSIGLYWSICFFCGYTLKAIRYKYAQKENIAYIISSSNVYENRLYLNRKYKLKLMIERLKKCSIKEIASFLFYNLLAQIYLLKIKSRFTPPMKNLLYSVPVNPEGISWINITKYVHWDIEKIIRDLKTVGWNPPSEKKLPMRFDCQIEDSFINYTYKKALGITVHGIICNNLIYDNLLSKQDLQEICNYYDQIIEHEQREVLNKLSMT